LCSDNQRCRQSRWKECWQGICNDLQPGVMSSWQIAHPSAFFPPSFNTVDRKREEVRVTSVSKRNQEEGVDFLLRLSLKGMA